MQTRKSTWLFYIGDDFIGEAQGEDAGEAKRKFVESERVLNPGGFVSGYVHHATAVEVVQTVCNCCGCQQTRAMKYTSPLFETAAQHDLHRQMETGCRP